MITIGFDVDNTLWKVVEYKVEPGPLHPRGWAIRQVPDYALVPVLQWFFHNGDKIYVWSAGGVDYAKTICEKLGIDHMVEIIQKGNWTGRPHVDLCFDDEDVKLATVNVKVKRDPLQDPI